MHKAAFGRLSFYGLRVLWSSKPATVPGAVTHDPYPPSRLRVMLDVSGQPTGARYGVGSFTLNTSFLIAASTFGS